MEGGKTHPTNQKGGGIREKRENKWKGKRSFYYNLKDSSWDGAEFQERKAVRKI